MNLGLFSTQLNEIDTLLKSLELFRDRVYNPPYPDKPQWVFKGLDYFKIWEVCFSERYFHFQLVDDALVHFRVESFQPLSLSYTYYECPYMPSTSFPEYIMETYQMDETQIESEQLDQRDFADFYTSAEKKLTVTPLRYDYSPRLYNEGLHPASHLHFGHGNHIRVATRKILRPMSFVCFLIRQFYPTYWKHMFEHPACENIVRNVRDNLDEVEAAYWQQKDSWEMCLH